MSPFYDGILLLSVDAACLPIRVWFHPFLKRLYLDGNVLGSLFSILPDCFYRTDVRRRHRGQHASPDSPSYDDQACITSISPRNDRSPHPTETPLVWPTPTAKSAIKYLREPSIEADATEKSPSTVKSGAAPSRSVVKRRRANLSDTSTMKPLFKKGTPQEPRKPTPSTQANMVPWEADHGHANVHSFNWGNDPYEVDPEVTMHYIETYFIHINAATYRIFPRKLFLKWVKTETAKSPDDLMILYTMLAMGSVFSSKAERKHEGSLFNKIARYAVEKNHGKYSLQLVQSRLLLAFYHFSLGEPHKAWDYGGMAFRVASGLKLNLEEGVTDISDDDLMDYGLNRHALAECRRRTFWSAYMMDVSSLGRLDGRMCSRFIALQRLLFRSFVCYP